MTTGGGWQDQIGGLLPAFKLGKSHAQLPLEVEWRQLNVKDNQNIPFWDELDQRLILVYTGQTRLARNLLQSVLRNWYSGSLSELFDELEENALQAAEAVEQGRKFLQWTHSFSSFDSLGDLVKLGQCMSLYWQQKLRVAPGSEPETCRQLIDLLTPYIYGKEHVRFLSVLQAWIANYSRCNIGWCWWRRFSCCSGSIAWRCTSLRRVDQEGEHSKCLSFLGSHRSAWTSDYFFVIRCFSLSPSIIFIR